MTRLKRFKAGLFTITLGMVLVGASFVLADDKAVAEGIILCKYRSRKPEGVAVELADAVIRIADLCGHLGIDLEEVIEIKMAYNEGRPYKHGKKF